MAFSFDIPFCLTPVSVDGRSPVRSPNVINRVAAVRLSCSISAISAVLHAVLGKRIQQGDDFRTQADHIRRNGSYDLAAAAIVAPIPQSSITGFERAYHSAQFAATLAPTASCPFTSCVLPDISIQAYIARLLSFNTTVSNASYVLMLALLDKLMLYNPEHYLHSSNAHRLILAAFVVAAKYHEDNYIPNADFARIGGVSVNELNLLEVTFLNALDWRCHFSNERFEQVESAIIEEALDTPQGLSVFQTLRSQNIAALDDAVRMTRSWTMGAAVPISPVLENLDPNWLGCDWNKAHASTLRHIHGDRSARGIIAGIALALASFNYPQVPLFPMNDSEILQLQMFSACYPAPARARLFTLQSLASASFTTATIVPSMFATPFATAFKPDIPIIKSKNTACMECGSVAKASVHFLLNDTDPFEDLPTPLPVQLPAPCSVMATMERECGLEGLLQ